MPESSQLEALARRFPAGFVERKDGNDYVAHHIINQRLLTVVGPFDFELVQVIRGSVPAVAPDPSGRSRRAKAGTPALDNAVVGGVWRLACEIDGRRVRIEEVGDVGDVHNWPNDGARLKDAASDALKRCAMRIGLGLSLWAQEHYFLDEQLKADDGEAQAKAEGMAAVVEPSRKPETAPEPEPEPVAKPAPAKPAPAKPAPAKPQPSAKPQPEPAAKPERPEWPSLPPDVEQHKVPSLDDIVDNAGLANRVHLGKRVAKREAEWLAAQFADFGSLTPRVTKPDPGWLLNAADRNVVLRWRLARLVLERRSAWKQAAESEHGPEHKQREKGVLDDTPF